MDKLEKRFNETVLVTNCNLVRLLKDKNRLIFQQKIIIFLLLTILTIGTIFSQDKVTASVYNAVAEQCNDDYMHTAFMFELDTLNPFKHRIIAVSRDLLVKYPKGTKVSLKGTFYDGTYVVMDKMNKRFTNRIDILINKDMPIGFWRDITITLINARVEQNTLNK